MKVLEVTKYVTRLVRWAPGVRVCPVQEPDGCWDFMHYLMEDEFQGFLAENQFLVPAKKKHQQRFFRVPPQYPYQHPAVFADVYKKPYGIYWNHYRSSEDSALYNAEIGKIILGEMFAQGTLNALESRLDALIDTGPGENPYKGLSGPSNLDSQARRAPPRPPRLRRHCVWH